MTWRWAGARLGGAVLTLFGVTIVVFVVLRAIPGDAITSSLGIESGTLTPAQTQALTLYYGLDKPWYVQFFAWVGQVLRGNLGVSLTSGNTVGSLIGAALPVTVELAVLAAIIGTVIGVLLGTLAGSGPGRARDGVTQGVGLLGLAVPEFVLGILMVAFLAARFDYFPDTSTFVPITTSFSANMSQMLYPALVLAVGFAANVMRTTRSEYVEVAQADFVRTARGKGLAPGRIRFAHILRNAGIPILTVTGIQFGYLLGGTVIIEQIFALPGLGRLLFTAITNHDYPIVQSSVLVVAVAFVLVNLLVDLAYRAVDPRVRQA
ncbi:ABC transporter permease [Nakamurella endophytica]|uniref:ABC transporter permease n=1 Tax=Nakamurella endophytica TaxID=1748367 RepID=A0A917SK95_9ACTN|nr:ABC transporter permease [Nakamurella endophytica]GGL86673.1 ABC transporter permease [Nakamurella endophytica]